MEATRYRVKLMVQTKHLGDTIVTSSGIDTFDSEKAWKAAMHYAHLTHELTSRATVCVLSTNVHKTHMQTYSPLGGWWRVT